MKKILFITCAVLLFKPVFPVLQYALDYEYISKVLCVNKARPEMHCNGKCHLMKELAKAAEKESPATSDKKSQHSETEILFFSPLQAFVFNSPDNDQDMKINAVYSDLYQYLSGKTSFRPPASISWNTI